MRTKGWERGKASPRECCCTYKAGVTPVARAGEVTSWTISIGRRGPVPQGEGSVEVNTGISRVISKIQRGAYVSFLGGGGGCMGMTTYCTYVFIEGAFRQASTAIGRF